MARNLQRGVPGGEAHPAAKLTEEQAREILARVSSGERQKDLAIEYGVTPSCVSHLVRGTSWPHLGGAIPPPRVRGPTKLVEADIPVILTRIEKGESIASVARSYGVSRTTVAKVWHGKTWKNAPRPEKRRRAVWKDVYGVPKKEA
jgi:DNA invertase Pin-like site-specific DNA recombinase